MPRAVSRRSFVQATATALGSALLHARPTGQGTTMTALTAMDHLLLGVADLDAGIAWIEGRSGVRAVVGGSHPGRGTRNALLAFAGRQYLEIVAPDPAQTANPRPEFRELREPRLIGWAAASRDIEEVGRRIRAAGLSTPGPRPGSRQRPDGRELRWTAMSVATPLAAGPVNPVPFFIEWDAGSAHPAQDSPRGCDVLSLEFEHPDADALRRTLTQLGLEATVRTGATARIVATLQTPRGRLILT